MGKIYLEKHHRPGYRLGGEQQKIANELRDYDMTARLIQNANLYNSSDARDLFQQISQSVDGILHQLVDGRICDVSPITRSFFIVLFFEAITLRSGEGAALGLPIQDNAAMLSHFGYKLSQVLTTAASLNQYESRYSLPVVSLISVLEVITLQWCKIFPICRPACRTR